MSTKEQAAVMRHLKMLHDGTDTEGIADLHEHVHQVVAGLAGTSDHDDDHAWLEEG